MIANPSQDDRKPIANCDRKRNPIGIANRSQTIAVAAPVAEAASAAERLKTPIETSIISSGSVTRTEATR